MIQRVYKKDSYHHVYNRGNQKRKTFLEEQDYKVFLSLVSKYSQKYNINMIAYCLIPNHYHFILQQSDKYSLMKFMHGLGTAYSKYHNWKYKTVGHVFQGPYRATHIEDEDFLSDEINYVLNNPIKHGIVTDSGLYRWVGLWEETRFNTL